MGIRVDWDNEDHTIMHYRFDQHWTWEEFETARKQAIDWIDTVTHKVGVIVETPPEMVVPPNVLTHVRHMLRTKHANTVIITFVVTDPLLRTMIITLRSIAFHAPVSIEIAATLDEARDIIHQHLKAPDSTPS